MEKLPTSQPAAGDISCVARYQDGADISLLDCLKTGFPLALISPALRSTTFGTEEMYLHCILCVAFDDKRALVFERPFCKPGPGTTCQRCTAGNLACFRALESTSTTPSWSHFQSSIAYSSTFIIFFSNLLFHFSPFYTHFLLAPPFGLSPFLSTNHGAL